MKRENHFQKNQIKKFFEKTENQCKMPCVNKKPLARRRNFIQTKNTRPRMKYGWIGENHLKIQSKKFKKRVKIKVKFPHVNKKPLAKERIFFQTPFSHSTLKLDHTAKPLAFSLHFLLRRDQNHYSNCTSKIENVRTDLIYIKKQRPNTIQIL